MQRDRTSLLLSLAPLALAFGVVMSCASSEPVDTHPTGAAGTSATGAAGASAAGTSAAGSSATGAAGTSATGAAGTNATGTAGTSATGAAGTSATGAAGRTGAAGTSATGAAGTSAGGTTGAAGTGAAATLSFATDIYPFIKTQCTPCHIANTDGMLSMKDATTAYTNLVGTTMGVSAKTDTGCKLLDASKKRVVPGDPAHSYIYIKISTAQAMLTSNTCGPAMPQKPQSMLTLTTDQIQKIRDWIMSGAKP